MYLAFREGGQALSWGVFQRSTGDCVGGRYAAETSKYDKINTILGVKYLSRGPGFMIQGRRHLIGLQVALLVKSFLLDGSQPGSCRTEGSLNGAALPHY